jgi:thioredoxin 1
MTALNFSIYRKAQGMGLSSAPFFLACLTLCLSFTGAYASEDKTPDHIGKITAQELMSAYPEFAKEYNDFKPSAEQLKDIQALAGKDIVTLFGTWCHDSEREVPRLLKLLELGNVQVKQLTLYAVSRQKDDPNGYSEKYQLMYTPTIVVNDGPREIARVVERPEGSLAGDLAEQINSDK